MEIWLMLRFPVYLDYNATTPVDPRVLEKMLPYFCEHFGNAASRTHAYGWMADEAVKTARRQVAELIHATEQEIVFTSGATEAINLALKGTFDGYRSKGKHIVSVSTEHRAVLDTCKALEERGAEVTYLSVSREGTIDLDELKKSLRDNTILVSVMYANNETGLVQPVKQVAEIVHEKGAIFMSDATQAAGKIKVDVEEDGIDLLCLSAHKFYGPKGAGALYVRRKKPRVTLHPQLDGGGHERGLRSGTLNVPGIVGLGEACAIAGKEMWDDAARCSILRTMLEQAILDLGNVYVNGSQRHRLPHVTNLSFQGITAADLIRKISTVAVATGSACTSALAEPSHVLKAMGVPDSLAYSSIRFSLGKYTTKEEIEHCMAVFNEAITTLRN